MTHQDPEVFAIEGRREVRVIRMGMKLAQPMPDEFTQSVFDAEFEANKYLPPSAGNENLPVANPWMKRTRPVFEVTPDNVSQVSQCLDEVISLGGLKGAVANLLGRKETAQDTKQKVEDWNIS